VIPAIIAYRNDEGAAELAHAVGDYSDRAFCGQWTLQRTERRWPTTPEEWDQARARCPVCAALVYA
jgi:hypothetical protein